MFLNYLKINLISLIIYFHSIQSISILLFLLSLLALNFLNHMEKSTFNPDKIAQAVTMTVSDVAVWIFHISGCCNDWL